MWDLLIIVLEFIGLALAGLAIGLAYTAAWKKC